MFRVILCILFYRLTQLLFSTLLKGIIRKECQSFTNHGHDKTPPTVFNPLSLWLTLPRDMGVSHTLLPPSITRTILACLWFAQGSKKQNGRAVLWCSGWFDEFNFIGWRNFFFQHYLRALSAKNANHLQTTDTLKRHQRYSIHYHCGWPPSGYGGQPHTQWPSSVTRAILACLWFAQGLHKAQKKSKQQSRSMMFRVIRWILFYRLMQLIFSTLLNEGKNLTSMSASGQAYESLSWRCATEGY